MHKVGSFACRGRAPPPPPPTRPIAWHGARSRTGETDIREKNEGGREGPMEEEKMRCPPKTKEEQQMGRREETNWGKQQLIP